MTRCSDVRSGQETVAEKLACKRKQEVVRAASVLVERAKKAHNTSQCGIGQNADNFEKILQKYQKIAQLERHKEELQRTKQNQRWEKRLGSYEKMASARIQSSLSEEKKKELLEKRADRETRAAELRQQRLEQRAATAELHQLKMLDARNKIFDLRTQDVLFDTTHRTSTEEASSNATPAPSNASPHSNFSANSSTPSNATSPSASKAKK
jgi:hypothetical protein